MAVAFRMARDAVAAFITKNWVAAQLKRSAHFVQRNWHRSPQDLQTEFRGSRPWFSPKKVAILWVRAALLSFRYRLDAVIAASGGHTDY